MKKIYLFTAILLSFLSLDAFANGKGARPAPCLVNLEPLDSKGYSCSGTWDKECFAENCDEDTDNGGYINHTFGVVAFYQTHNGLETLIISDCYYAKKQAKVVLLEARANGVCK